MINYRYASTKVLLESSAISGILKVEFWKNWLNWNWFSKVFATLNVNKNVLAMVYVCSSAKN